MNLSFAKNAKKIVDCLDSYILRGNPISCQGATEHVNKVTQGITLDITWPLADSKGIANVTFSAAFSANEALKNYSSFCPKNWKVKASNKREHIITSGYYDESKVEAAEKKRTQEKKSKGKSEIRTSFDLFITGLAPHEDEYDVKKVLSRFGTITDTFLHRKKDEPPRNCESEDDKAVKVATIKSVFAQTSSDLYEIVELPPVKNCQGFQVVFNSNEYTPKLAVERTTHVNNAELTIDGLRVSARVIFQQTFQCKSSALKMVKKELSELVKRAADNHIFLEKVFYNKNTNSSLIVVKLVLDRSNQDSKITLLEAHKHICIQVQSLLSHEDFQSKHNFLLFSHKGKELLKKLVAEQKCNSYFFGHSFFLMALFFVGRRIH